MKLPLSELLDRYSIELRKDFYGHGNHQLIEACQADIREFLSNRFVGDVEYTDGKGHPVSTSDLFAIVHAAVLLGIRNADIANLEWQLRAKDPKITMEEHGRRAVAIRAINDGRNAAKVQLSKDLGENVETKHYGYGSLVQAEQVTKDVQPIPDIPGYMPPTEVKR